MQCQSYFPVYHSNYDLNLDANGGAKPIHNGNGTFQSGHYSKYVLPSPVPQGPLELVRQTILMHEATFRDQVQELHRLYRRQKELVGEIRSQQLYMNHLPLEVQSPNCFPNYSSNGGVQNTLYSFPCVNSHFKPSNVGNDNIETLPRSFKDHRISSTSILTQPYGNSNNLHIPESKGRKIGGKFLDLELPAEVYIDSEEGESLEDANFSEPHMPTTLLSLDKPFSALQGSLPISSSFPKSSTNLTDLNEPTMTSSSVKNDGIVGNKGTYIGLDILKRNHDFFNGGKARSDGASDTLKLVGNQIDYANSEVCSGSSLRKSSTISEKNGSVVQALPCFANQISSSKGAKIMTKIKGHIDHKLDASSTCKSLKNSCSNLKDSMVSLSSVTTDHWIHVNGLNYIDLNSDVVGDTEFTPCSDTAKCSPEVNERGKDAMLSKSNLSEVSLSCETVRRSRKCRLIDINLPCDPTSVEEPLSEDHPVGGDYSNSARINLNSPMNDDGSSPKTSCSERIALEIDLEAPPSPEVEERPPPRGDSEENLLETGQVSTPEEDGGDPFEELAKIAAEAIVSISSSPSSKTQPFPDFQKCEASDSGTLEWFAGLIHSISHDLEKENDFGSLNYNNTYKLDEFEAMTLELTEMKEEEYWSKSSSAQIENLSCSMPLGTQMRKGRTRRSKRKDFQREVLPSLTSLSRYEVTEDIQMIEGLMEAAGTPCHLTRGRRACRMGRKPRAAKKPISEMPESHDGPLMSWGKANRQPRGERNRASPSMVLTRWLEFSA